MEVLKDAYLPADIEDREWVQLFQSGKEAGFNRLVLEHKDRIYSLCVRLLQNRDDAEDCAQETFVKVYHGLKDFRMESMFSSWLYRIAVNTCKNKQMSKPYREAKQNQNLDAADGEGESKAEMSASLMSSVSPEQVLENKTKGAAIEAAIARLPENQRVLIVLRDIEGRSYEEVAETVGLNLGTVKSRINRGRLQLQEWLRELS